MNRQTQRCLGAYVDGKDSWMNWILSPPPIWRSRTRVLCGISFSSIRFLYTEFSSYVLMTAMKYFKNLTNAYIMPYHMWQSGFFCIDLKMRTPEGPFTSRESDASASTVWDRSKINSCILCCAVTSAETSVSTLCNEFATHFGTNHKSQTSSQCCRYIDTDARCKRTQKFLGNGP